MLRLAGLYKTRIVARHAASKILEQYPVLQAVKNRIDQNDLDTEGFIPDKEYAQLMPLYFSIESFDDELCSAL